jgi:hypothetical protein
MAGMPEKNASNAASPPAEAPMPTIGKSAADEAFGSVGVGALRGADGALLGDAALVGFFMILYFSAQYSVEDSRPATVLGFLLLAIRVRAFADKMLFVLSLGAASIRRWRTGNKRQIRRMRDTRIHCSICGILLFRPPRAQL